MSQKDNKPQDDAKKIIDELLNKCKDGNYIFRGTTSIYSNTEYGISSSLYREYAKSKDNSQESPFNEHFHPINIEKEIVNKAKRLFPDNARNIEILTELQHYGGKTTLIDFSYNLYIALFFACGGKFSEDGEVILFNLANTKTKRTIDYKENDLTISIIKPAIAQISKMRVAFQSSVFVYAPRGYIDKAKLKYKTHTIKKKHKSLILDFLRKVHNITVDTIYNDLIGFIDNEENYKSANAEFYRGLSAQEQGDNRQAIEFYNKAIKINPKLAEAYNNRGLAKAAIGQYQQAIEDYDKALEINPRDAGAYTNRGLAKSAIGQHQQAIEDHDKALEIDPKLGGIYNNRGNAKFKLAETYNEQGNTESAMGKYQQAIEDYDKALEIDPRDAVAYTNRGLAKAAIGQYQQAIEDYNKALVINPRDAEAYNGRGVAKYNIGQYQQALEDYNKALEINAEYTEAYNNRGNVKSVMGQYQQALKDYDKALDTDPEYAEAYCNRGNAKSAIGDKTGAKKDYKIAIKLSEQQGKNNLAQHTKERLKKLEGK